VRLWSVTEGQEICNFSNHSDYVRSLATSELSTELFASGSYDGKICLFNANSQSLILCLDHGVAVEDVKFVGSLCISCGGNFVKIWDVSVGGKLLQIIECHQKTISCLALSSNGHFLLTGSLDRQVKVIDLASFEIVGSFKFEAAVMSLSVNVCHVYFCLRVPYFNRAMILKSP
jgi:U3 small nucleolar RNA-associated protein 15